MPETRIQFPDGFYWGAATCAYQIEGSSEADGKGKSIWDTFSHLKGKIADGSNGDVACDHYLRFAEDVTHMRALGLNSYRLSVSWPRIMPEGRGTVNWVGMDFYDRLVDALLQAGITPHITLYHWDLPQKLHDKGGWGNRDTCSYFGEYAAAVVHHLGDRVKHWFTINEPWVVAVLGYFTGEHAPGLKNKKLAVQVGHHLLLGHGKAMEAIRASGRDGLKAGIALNLAQIDPETDSEEDKEIAEQRWKSDNMWFLEPILHGEYPKQALKYYGPFGPKIHSGDLDIICKPMDFLGVNYYTRFVIGKKGVLSRVPGSDYQEMGWEVAPSALRRMLLRMQADYKLPPIVISENGMSLKDSISSDGQVHDPRRIAFIRDHLTEIHKAMEAGVKVDGYFCWSLMDNFEWQHGFTKRFGLIYTDYENQRRIFKDSANWYRDVIKANGFDI